MTNALDDEIVDEIRRRREVHAEALGFDLKRITEDLQRQEEEAGTPLVNRLPRSPRRTPKRSSA